MLNSYSYYFSTLAIEDLDSVMKYLTEKLFNKLAAINLFEEIDEAINKICTFPYAFPTCNELSISDETIRHFQIGKYYLFYKIEEVNKKIIILRFRYSKMDFSKKII